MQPSEPTSLQSASSGRRVAPLLRQWDKHHLAFAKWPLEYRGWRGGLSQGRARVQNLSDRRRPPLGRLVPCFQSAELDLQPSLRHGFQATCVPPICGPNHTARQGRVANRNGLGRDLMHSQGRGAGLGWAGLPPPPPPAATHQPAGRATMEHLLRCGFSGHRVGRKMGGGETGAKGRLPSVCPPSLLSPRATERDRRTPLPGKSLACLLGALACRKPPPPPRPPPRLALRPRGQFLVTNRALVTFPHPLPAALGG